MTLPVWNVGVPDSPLIQGWKWDPVGDPLESEFEGRNKRLRSPPGSNIARTQFGIKMTLAQYNTFLTWYMTTLGRGASRFTSRIWNGYQFLTAKTCQFAKKPEIDSDGVTVVVSLDLWVYNV
jgi:hypothetical protein